MHDGSDFLCICFFFFNQSEGKCEASIARSVLGSQNEQQVFQVLGWRVIGCEVGNGFCEDVSSPALLCVRYLNNVIGYVVCSMLFTRSHFEQTRPASACFQAILQQMMSTFLPLLYVDGSQVVHSCKLILLSHSLLASMESRYRRAKCQWERKT